MFKSIARTHEASLFIVTAAFRKPRPFPHIFDRTPLDRTPRSLTDTSLGLVSQNLEDTTVLARYVCNTNHQRQLTKVLINVVLSSLVHVDAFHHFVHLTFILRKR